MRSAIRLLVASGVALGGIAILVAVAIRTGRDVEIAALSLVLIGFLVSLRWPLVPLFALAVLIPFEEAVVIGGLGTLSRYAMIMFIVVYGIPRLGRLTIRAMPVAGWGYVAWAIFSVTWAIDSSIARGHLEAFLLGFVVAVLVASVIVEQPTIVRPILWAYSLSAAATALLAIVAFVLTGGPGGDRVAGLADQNPAYFAAILLPALVFAFHELLFLRWVLPSAMVIFLCALGIVISGTRGAWVSVLVVFVFFILPRLEPMRRVAAIGIVLAILIVGLQVPGVATLVDQRTDTALASGGSGRTDIWSIGLRIFGSAPWTGVGFANFSIANTPELARDTPVSIQSADAIANLGPHNVVFGTLGELGVIGIVLLTMFLAPLIVRTGWGEDAAAVQAALASLVVIALFLDVLARKELWLLIGLACGLSYLRGRREPAGGTGPAAQPALGPPPRWLTPRSSV